MNYAGPPPAYTPPQQQLAVEIQPVSSAAVRAKARGNWKGLRVTGYLHLFLGIISVLLGIVAFVFKPFMFQLGNPIWAGIASYTVSGILGIAAGGGNQNRQLVTAYLVMSILASVVGSGLTIAHSLAIIFELCPDSLIGAAPYYWEDQVGCSSTLEVRMTINILIVLVAFAEMVVGIVGASLTCSFMCYGPPTTHVVTYTAPNLDAAQQPQSVVQYSAMPQQQYVQQPQFGNVMYPGQQTVVSPGEPQSKF